MKIKKIIVPIIITSLLLIYLVAFTIGWYNTPSPRLIKFLGITISIGFIAGSIFVLIERIKEIRSGEEDDLSKY